VLKKQKMEINQMKKAFLPLVCVLLSACSYSYDAYKLKTANNLDGAHGQSIYFRSSLRSGYAGTIRRILSNKFGEMGIKTATSAENAEYIAIFDIETFYKQDTPYKNTSLANTASDGVLFSDSDDSSSLYFSGNANMKVDNDKTCFTLNIGQKGTSRISYASSFCANTVTETEDFVPLVVDLYGKYATIRSADIGVQCLTAETGDVSCEPIYDRQNAFLRSLWIDSTIGE
jgi:hypothetical protein